MPLAEQYLGITLGIIFDNEGQMPSGRRLSIPRKCEKPYPFQNMNKNKKNKPFSVAK